MSFKFISSSETGDTAAEADTLPSGDLGSQLVGQSKTGSFAIGNTGTTESIYTVTVSGINTAVNNDVELSLDTFEWETSVIVSGVHANRISDAVFYKYTPSADTPSSNGSFLLRIDED